jgi:hypothetical protein
MGSPTMRITGARPCSRSDAFYVIALRPTPMHSAKIIERCDLCGERFQYGPVAYFGTYVPAYQVMVCHRCYAANWDGWALKLDETVTRNLKAKGLRIPERNTKGLLPRDGF